MDPIRIGTRGSALARWQADHVASALASLDGALETRTVLIQTEGDAIRDIPLSQVEGKAFFTKEIEAALLDGEVDVAVHSLKDLATQMPPGLALEAVMEREDPRDVLVLREGKGEVTLEALPRGARVGTSSLRRRALLARKRPDLRLEPMRGNVPTRIQKLDAGEVDALVLASAGVKRLGMAHRISGYLPPKEFLPAVSQGAIGIQIRSGNGPERDWIRRLDHGDSRVATTGERAFLRRVEGGCHVPVGALGVVDSTGLRLHGIVCALDGTRWVEGERQGEPDQAEEMGVDLAEDLLARGGREILNGIRHGAAGI